MSQHKNPAVWQFLRTLIETVELERQREKAEPFEEVLDDTEEFKLTEEIKLFTNTIKLPSLKSVADTGSSSVIKYDYTLFNQQLDNFALMTRYDQQIIRTLSNNLSEHQVFFSSPKFISDLIHISEILKGVQQSERSTMLKELLE
jgi:hypothetical protein